MQLVDQIQTALLNARTKPLVLQGENPSTLVELVQHQIKSLKDTLEFFERYDGAYPGRALPDAHIKAVNNKLDELNKKLEYLTNKQ